MNGCFLLWRKLRIRTQYPCNPPGRPSLGNRLPPPSTRETVARYRGGRVVTHPCACLQKISCKGIFKGICKW